MPLGRPRFVDFYKLLRIAPSASVSEVKIAFYGLAKQCHPDVMAGRGTEAGRASTDERFKQIHEAYQTLIHDRVSYDREYERHYQAIPASLRSFEEQDDPQDSATWSDQKKRTMSHMKTGREERNKAADGANRSRRTVYPTAGPWGSCDKPSFVHLGRLSSQAFSFLGKNAPLKKNSFYWSDDDDTADDDANENELDYLSMMDLHSYRKRNKRRFHRAGTFQRKSDASPSPFCSKACDPVNANPPVTPVDVDPHPAKTVVTDEDPRQEWPNGGRFLRKGNKV